MSPPEGRTAISFDPFDDPVHETGYGDKRGLAAHASMLGGAFLLLSGVLVFALDIAAPRDLTAMPISDHEMLRFAEQGYFPLSAAAVSLNRSALAFCANLQTFAYAVIVIFGLASSARRGFASGRVRGWTNGVWIGGLAAACLAPSVFPELTPQMLDYAVTGSWGGAKATPVDAIYGEHGLNRSMRPAVFLLERAVAGAVALVALAYVLHDLGYRVREALEDFGFIEEQGPADATVRPSVRANRGSNAGFGTGEAGADAAFGQRDRSRPLPQPEAPDMQARRVLGVGAAASRREIERAYRSQMKRAHPDRGGSVERASALNAARDTLLGRG